VVAVDSPRLEAATFVSVEDRAGARAVADHLTALGHRRVALIVPTLVPDGRVGRVDQERRQATAYHVDRERLEGLRQGLEAAGIDWRDVPIEEGENRQEAGAAAARTLLAEAPPPTALIATTDQLALGAIRGVRALDLKVPADVSVVGFDDIPEAARSQPPLTTVRQPHVDKGALAGDRLFALLDGSPAPDTLLPVELVVRESTGPAPAS
jgi:DNA-binding LacI/PurR family transcriptional regulator